MPSPHETHPLIRRIAGTDIATDPVFLGPSYVQRSTNWAPDDAFTLSKRRGTAPYQAIGGTLRIDVMRRVQGPIDRYLYAVAIRGGFDDALYVSVNDSPFQFVAPFPGIAGGRYGMAVRGEQLYVGNGQLPLRRVPFGGAPVVLSPPGTTNETGAAVVITADSASGLLPGTYAYAWAVYDDINRRIVSRGQARSVTLTGSWSRVTFTAPSGALGVGETYHLFVADADQDLIGAHDQTPGGLAAGATYQLVAVVATGLPVPVPFDVIFTGQHLVAHRARVFMAGDVADPRTVKATGLLIPGLEQEIFDQGDLFPANARFPIDYPVTGLGVVGPSTAQTVPTAPLAAFSLTSTWLLLGDILDDPTAQLMQLSGQIGCMAQQTIANTPWGLVWAGPESVYLLPAGNIAEPVDIGWPIAPAIKAIPAIMRALTCAVYHRGFYKLAIAEAGGLSNTVEWWLDCRRPPGTDPPAWFGPHRRPAVTCFARSAQEPSETDRAWSAQFGSGTVLLLDQPTFADAGVPIVAEVQSGRIDLGTPFQPKLMKRVRVHARTGSVTEFGVTVVAAGTEASQDPPSIHPKTASGFITLRGSEASIWNVSAWNTASWGGRTFARGRHIFTAPEPRGTSFELTLTHTEQVPVTLRDVDLGIQVKEDRGD